MGRFRFLFDNLISDEDMITVSSLTDGMVSLPIKGSTSSSGPYGRASMDTTGDYSGQVDREYVVEIDSVSSGYEIGQATFKWSDNGGSTWNQQGITTTASYYTLNHNVQIKWTGATGHDFELGDRWTFIAFNNFSAGRMIDCDRDTRYRSASSALGSELVTNGTFDSNINGWNNSGSNPYETLEWQSGKLHAVNTSGMGVGGSDDNISVVSGNLYKISFDINVSSGESPLIVMKSSLGGTQRFNMGTCGTGSHTFYWTPTITENVAFQFQDSLASDFTLDNVSVKKVPTTINIDLGSAQEVKSLILYDHNLTSSAVITLKGDAGADWNDPDFKETMSWNTDKILHYLGAGTTKRHWRIEIDDHDNPDGYVEIGELYLGTFLEPSKNVAMGYGRSLDFLHSASQTSFGVNKKRFYNLRRSWKFQYHLLESEDLDDLINMIEAITDRSTGQMRPVYFNQDPDAASEFYLAEINNLPQSVPFNDLTSVEISLREVMRSV
ncbi:MAG: hypothetical protein JRI95_13980 [Deltaproteobacteria bacterium]|nr:hypothetical protein [Deltaproteobacteria bacterium]MBW2084725.1 hypothetical protein [Deltaproteobacteria bacterium]